MTAVPEHLARVVARFGGAALADPVALRAALRATAGEPDDLPAVSVEALVLAADGAQPAGSWAARVLAAARGGAAEATAPPAALLPAVGSSRSVEWGEPEGGAVAPTRRLAVPNGRRWIVGLAVLLVAAVAAAGVLLVRGSGTPAPPDRTALDQVGQRYRALGARLLDGALDCAALPVEPGVVERLRCGFGTFALELRTYDSASRVRELRPSTPADAVRSARRTSDVAAFVMSQQRAGSSTVHWDVATPRPVSATVTAPVVLPDLVAFYDQRGFGGLRRPDLDGPQFRSAALWELAAAFVAEADCAAVVPTADELEAVQCTLPDGTRAQFARFTGDAPLRQARVAFADPASSRPGTIAIGGWTRGGGIAGQTVAGVRAADGRPSLYFDEDATSCYGALVGPAGSTVPQLFDRFRGAVPA